MATQQAGAADAIPRQALYPGMFAPLSAGMSAAFAASARLVAQGIEDSLPDDDALLALLPEALRAGSPHGYVRYLVHADPLARYSAMLLVWRPGQHSPVHGHQTWCAYRVLQGTLHERHYRWDAQAQRARQCGEMSRTVGDTFSVPAGLRHIHALGNDGDEVAVSLHIYGVDQEHIGSGVNLLVDAA
ncbi:cysteine dioxygenase [Cupriavidus sp. 30B13]|uniref:cysteine dioxygenase family protein n=1 Tax=Cupriavidus sp. 30B13 TaxID=3384241 RepID=UPI003B900CC2